MTLQTVRRSITMPAEMHVLLTQIAAKRGRDITESDLIREAIREYLDQQADVVGSRRHFQRSLQTRLDGLEETLKFHLHILMALVATLLDEPSEAIDEAIIAARRDGQHLLARIQAIRDMKP